MTETDTEFERVLREQAKVKNIPNSRFEDGQFTFADYFDIEAFKESYGGSVEDEDSWPDWAFEPYKTYFGDVPEIETGQEHDDLYWFNVSVNIPEDSDRQRLLAHLVSDAVRRRKER